MVCAVWGRHMHAGRSLWHRSKNSGARLIYKAATKFSHEVRMRCFSGAGCSVETSTRANYRHCISNATAMFCSC